MDSWSAMNPEQWPWSVKVAAGVIVAILILCVLSFFSRPASLHADLRDLVVHAAQMHEVSKQDSDAALALQHNTTALAYLSMARRFASDSAIQSATNVLPADLERTLQKHQASCISTLTNRDPTLSSLLAGYSSL